jgi:hypothetical protein
VRHRNQQGEGSTTHQTGKNPGSNSDLPQEAEGRLITSQRPLVTAFGVKPFLSGSGRQVEVLCYVKVYKTPQELAGLSFSQEIATTEVKGWIKKKKNSSKEGDS